MVESIPDEMLMAYADGSLASTEHARMERLLASDPQLRARLEPFVASRLGLAEIFCPLVDAPIPERFVAKILASTAAAKSVEAKLSRPRSPWRVTLISMREALFGYRLQPIAAIAFTSLLLVGAAAGWLLSRLADFSSAQSAAVVAIDDSGLNAANVLAKALETGPSGQTVTFELRDGVTGSITPVLTFRSNESRFCRQYKIELSDSRRYVGLGCRTDRKQWRVIVHLEIDPRMSSPGMYRPASTSGSAAVDAAVNVLIAGEALGPESESALIENEWAEDRQR